MVTIFYSKRNSVNALISVILIAFLLEFNLVCKILTFSVQNHTWCVNLVILRKFCEKSHCFPGKFTQLAQILHDRRSRQTQLCEQKSLSDDTAAEENQDLKEISQTPL